MDARHLAAFRRRRLELLQSAKQAALTEAVHYGGFHVGTAMCALVFPVGYRIFTAGNHYPKRGGPRECAEHRVLRRTGDSDVELVVAVVTYGPPRPDDFSGKAGKTLHPCGFCRWEVHRHLLNGGPIRADSLYVGVSPEGEIEEMTYQQILDLHGVPTVEELVEKRRRDGALHETAEHDFYNLNRFMRMSRDRKEQAEREWLMSRFLDRD